MFSFWKPIATAKLEIVNNVKRRTLTFNTWFSAFVVEYRCTGNKAGQFHIKLSFNFSWPSSANYTYLTVKQEKLCSSILARGSKSKSNEQILSPASKWKQIFSPNIFGSLPRYLAPLNCPENFIKQPIGDKNAEACIEIASITRIFERFFYSYREKNPNIGSEKSTISLIWVYYSD